MSNHHLRNRNLSLKARGLLSTMLSLPEEWDYSLNGLAEIVKDGLSSVRTALTELEDAGYVERSQKKDNNGKFSKIIYNIYETPQYGTEEILFDFPITEKPITEKPIVGNRIQSNTNKLNTNKSNVCNNQSINQSNTKIGEIDMVEDIYDSYKELIKQNIGYEGLIAVEANVELIDEIVELMTEVVALNKMPLKIGGSLIPSEIVKKRFLSLDYGSIEYVLLALSRNTAKVRNIKSYLTASLFNSKTTKRSYYETEVTHDMYG